jgi:diguanylate cyclase (GGDEF)-like protein
LLQSRSSASRDAQLELALVENELSELQGAPFRADESAGGSAPDALNQIQTGKRRIGDVLADLERGSPPAALREVSGPLRENYAALDQIYELGASGVGYLREADLLATVASRAGRRIAELIDTASDEYERRAARSQMQAAIGSAVVILLLLLAFGFLYRRSIRARSLAERLVHENGLLLAASREEALQDSLTGLRNRRGLLRDLELELPQASREAPLLLAVFDLDGFKQYNDTFGHLAGDALLTRLGERLNTTLDGLATAYRMGGDEFCVLAPAGARGTDGIAQLAADSLTEKGELFSVGCSFGTALVPTDASTVTQALRLADLRMYEHKTGRSSASRQSTDVLLQVLSERSPEMHEHLSDVARLAVMTAHRLELPEHEVKRIQVAAELHDVGKTALPDTLLNKPAKLNAEEWRFMRSHTLIGERIVLAAPSLAHAADLVRSSHERFDGGGYPDGLVGEAIPLGASIIAVCDAFDAMTTDRAYRKAMSTDDARAELRSCSGTQFHPAVVDAVLPLTHAPELAAPHSV